MKFSYLPPRALPKSRLRAIPASLAILATLVTVMATDETAARPTRNANAPAVVA